MPPSATPAPPGRFQSDLTPLLKKPSRTSIIARPWSTAQSRAAIHMTLEDLTSEDDIEKQRSTRDFIAWFDALLDRINKSDDDELRKQVYLKTELAKRFYAEVWPLYGLMCAKRDAWVDALIQPMLGDQAGDVLFITSDPDLPSLLEITNAVDGEELHMQMRHLSEQGYTTLTGRVEQVMIDGKKTLQIWDEAVERTETVEAMSTLVRARVLKKSEKGYSANTALLIWVEDYGTFKSEKNHAVLRKVVDDTHDTWSKAFSHLYLMMSSNGSLYEPKRKTDT